MPTIKPPSGVTVPFTCRSNASAGGQLEHPSEVNSSTSTVFWADILTAMSTMATPAATVLTRLYIDSPAAHETHLRAGRLHIGMAGAHFLIEGRLGERKRLLQAFPELSLPGHQGRGRGGKLLVLVQGREA